MDSDSTERWLAAPKHLVLKRGEVHVWRASLDRGNPADYFPLLSAEERVRAERFKFDIHRNFFITARGILRSLLGQYLSRDPADLHFHYNEHGKPYLKLGKAKDLRFNLSHSHGVALFAFCYDSDIGVDLEFVDPAVNTAQLAERFFSPFEREQLRALPEKLRSHRFFLGWARKEAYIKARGKGMTIALSSFDVNLDPAEPATLLAIREQKQSPDHWTMVSLFLGKQFTAALVVEGKEWRLSCWDWRREEVNGKS